MSLYNELLLGDRVSKEKEVLERVQKINRDDFERLCLEVLEKMGFNISGIKSVQGDLLAEASIEREGEMRNFIIKFTRSPEDIDSEVKNLKGFLSPSTNGLLFTTDKIESEAYPDERIEIVGGKKLYQLLEKFNLLSTLARFEKEGVNSEKQEDFIEKGDKHLSNEEYQKAHQFYEKAGEVGDNQALPLYKKGEVFISRGKYEKAIEVLKKSLEINPKKVDRWLLLGDTYDSLDKTEEALDAYNKALDLKKDRLDALKNKGRLLYKMKRYDEAILCFEDILSIDSEAKEVWNNKALCHLRNGEYDDSLESINKALSIEPRFEEALLNKALIFEKMGNIEKALEVSNKLVEYFPNESEYHYVKGAYLNELDRYDEALEQMNRALELDPDNERARVAISDIERKT